MASSRLAIRSARAHLGLRRSFSSAAIWRSDQFQNHNKRSNDTVEEHRKAQTERPLNPHMTNTNSTITNDMPSLGKDKPPPEMISSVDPSYIPKDAVPEHTQHMTGGTQNNGSSSESQKELGVGEMEGASFRVEPLRRTGEDVNTQRARLLCPLLIWILMCSPRMLTLSFE
jgi:hypothetical protein